MPRMNDSPDRAIQAHGGGVSQDFPPPHLSASARTFRFADDPDTVHKRSLALQDPQSHEFEGLRNRSGRTKVTVRRKATGIKSSWTEQKP
jgi:hypothetical protein